MTSYRRTRGGGACQNLKNSVLSNRKESWGEEDMAPLGRNQGRTLGTECKARREAAETRQVSYGLVLDISTHIWWLC